MTTYAHFTDRLTTTVDPVGTSCNIPSAEEYIKKVEARGAIGKKRKSAKC